MYQCTLRFAEQLGIDYIDYNLAYEEMGIDWSQDFAGDARRMSVYGSEKFSRYLGAHLQQTYSLSDRREDSALAASWNDSAAYYERACALYELGKQDQFIAYLSELSQIDECVVVIAACDDASNALGQQDISAMRQLGLQEDLRGKFTWRYIAVLDDGRLLCERASPEDLQYEVRLSDDLVIEVTSGGQEAHILFNQQEASYQRRGMNIAVFDKRTGQIADQVSFDTYETRVGKHY